MGLRTRPAACVFLAVTALAKPSAGQMFTISASVDQDGRRYVYEISQERSDGLPQWDQQAASEPPLSMSEATKRGEAWLRSRTPEIMTFELNTLSLLRTLAPPGICRRGGCWYYRMTFDPVIAGRRLASGSDLVVVLIDGSIVEPRIENAPVAPSGAGRGGGASGGPGSGTGGGGGPRTVPVPSPDAGGVYTPGPGNGVIAPRVVQQAKPQYTRAAMSARVQGTVWLEAVVNTDGKVGEVKVIKSLDSVYGLDDEAIKAVRQFRFVPGTHDGVSVPVRVQVEMEFSLH
jgi:TonB family protein